MQKILLFVLFLVCGSFAMNLNIQMFKFDVLMGEYSFKNIKSWKYMDYNEKPFIRVELAANDFLDISTDGYEVKIK